MQQRLQQKPLLETQQGRLQLSSAALDTQKQAQWQRVLLAASPKEWKRACMVWSAT
jgi:hypothetical protein